MSDSDSFNIDISDNSNNNSNNIFELVFNLLTDNWVPGTILCTNSSGFIILFISILSVLFVFMVYECQFSSIDNLNLVQFD